MRSGKKKAEGKDKFKSNKECFQGKEPNTPQNKNSNCFKNTPKLEMSLNLKT